jgi:hypothetical protein
MVYFAREGATAFGASPGNAHSRRSSVACKGITSALDFGTISRSTPPAAFFQMSARPPPWARSMIGAVARGTVQPEER